MTNTATKHPFGELLAQYRARRPGFTQTRLAELTGYDQAILVRMSQGRKDLTGPSGRERIIRIIGTLADQNCLNTLEEANALLLAAQLPPLFERQPAEAKLIARLGNTPAGLSARRTNLPALISSFIGRTAEVSEVRQLLSTSRLVTLTGSGGAGKTRLAQRVASDVRMQFADGVWYVELAALNDPSQIADAAIRALGLAPSDQPALERLTEHLYERQALLVLDNCEHLIDAVAEFAIVVLQACPRVTILATSREFLDIEGEHTWRVPPMQPEEANRLFVERAGAIRNPISIDDETVTHICQQLDGMPLAIELAASRLQVMSLSDIAARLDDRFNLLAHGRRGALPRHQTLRAMIDWSYELLSHVEQEAFRRLGVFVGGWELDLAESLLGNNALAMVAQLVNKSLITVDEADGRMRYRYLETIREFALEKLSEAGECEAVQRMHAEVIAALAEASASPIHRKEQPYWVKRLMRETDNWRAALKWCFSSGQPQNAIVGCRLVGALFHYWHVAGHIAGLSERRWVVLALEALTDDMPADVQAWVHLAADGFIDKTGPYSRRAEALFQASGNRAGELIARGYVARTLFFERNYEAAVDMHERAVSESRACSDTWVLRFNLCFQADILRMLRCKERAEAIYLELLALSRADGDMHHTWETLLHFMSGAARERLQWAEAARCDQEAVALAESLGVPTMIGLAHTYLAVDIRHLGDLGHAIQKLEDCLTYAKDHGLDYVRMHCTRRLAAALVAQGDTLRAQALLEEAVLRARQTGHWFPYSAFDVMAVVAAARGDHERCARLRGLVDRMMDGRGDYRSADLEWEYAPFIAQSRRALGDVVFQAAYMEGCALSSDKAVEYAFSHGWPDKEPSFKLGSCGMAQSRVNFG